MQFLLFGISFLMVFTSSYLMASCFSPKDENNRPVSVYPFLYTLLIVFAQAVLSMELLSLFSAINSVNFLVINFLVLILSACLWNKNNRPLYVPKIKQTLKKILYALKRDKILMLMAFGFVFFIITAIVLDIFLPVNGGDALTYHLNRASFWMTQGNLNHFVISDDRNLVMPINSEILYLWNLLFFKNDIGLFLVSLTGFAGIIYCIYNILEYFGFTQRRILWSIFIMSSFASVMAQVSSLETDVLIAGLVLASVTLFLYALKDKKNSAIYFSSLAYALAIGTKSPAVIVFPGVFLLLAYFSYRSEKKEFYKPLLSFLGFLFLNFIIFSSYNYILNYIDYKNPLGSESARAIHGFRGGIKAFIANYIRYIFMMFDFSGFRYSEYVGEHILNAKFALFDLLHIPHEWGVEMSDDNLINNRFVNVKVGTGLLGFLVFLPSVITASILGFIKKSNKKVSALRAFGWMFFINIACLSGALAYMVFSVRFVTFIVILSCPVLALSYIKKTNIIKLLILFFVMSYFLIMSVNMAGRQHMEIAKVILQSSSIHQAREHIRCALYTGFDGKRPFCYIKDYIEELPRGITIGVFPSANDEFYIINMLNAHGYRLETLLPEKAPTYNLDKYDYVMTTNRILISTVLLTDTEHTKVEYTIDKNGNAYYPSYRPFSCVYETTGKDFYHKGMKDAVVMDSRCFIDVPFFEQKGFELIKVFNFESVINEHARYVSIYKNKKKS